MTGKQFILNGIVNRCIEETKMGDFMYGATPGSRYVWQYYMSRILYDRYYQYDIAREFHKLVFNNVGHWNFQIAGQDNSSIPLLASLPILLDNYYDVEINAFMIRRKRKSFGIHNWTEGLYNDKPVLLIDDLCNSTNGYLHGYRVCKNVLGLEVMPYIFAVVNKHGPKKWQEQAEKDKYLKHDFEDHKILSILNGEEVTDARELGPRPPTITI